LLPATKEGGSTPVELELSVTRAGAAEGVTKQRAASTDMIMGLLAILYELGTRDATRPPPCGPDKICAMEDIHGNERQLVNGQVLPAGSIVLTGTPGGTVIKSPSVPQYPLLLVRGGFSLDGAKRAYLADQLQNRVALGYLQEGDQVEQAITGLGRQTRTVGGTGQDLPAGTCAPKG
jgi:hypothetical protein